MRKSICMVILTTILSFCYAGWVFADSENTLLPEEGREYTVAELREIALGNSKQALIDDINIKRKEISLRSAKNGFYSVSDSVRRITRPMEAELELDIAGKTKQDHLKKLEGDVYKAAVAINLCEKEVELWEQKAVSAGEKLTSAEIKFRSEVISQDELDSARQLADSRSISLAGVRNKLDALYLALRLLTGMPLESTPVKIKVELTPADLKGIDLDSALSELYKSETSICNASGKVAIAQAALDIVSKTYREGDSTYDNYALDIEEAKIRLEEAKSDLAVKVKNKYNELLNRKDNMELAARYEELAMKKLTDAQVRHSIGVVGKDALTNAEEAALDAGYARLSAIADFNIGRIDFLLLLGRLD